MFEGLTKSKFYTKCKKSVKTTKTRLDALKKKKNAVARYLKNDIADLLKSGLDSNAYGRAEGLLVEQRVIACFNFIEQFCGCISTNLSVMNKQKECPEECKEAVQSLIYATARFAEFPELRDLRKLFNDRYGTTLESFISKEFVEALTPKPITKEMKLRILHDVAQEFAIEWDPKSLEQKLFKSAPVQQDQQSLGLQHTTDDDYDDDGFKWKTNMDDKTKGTENQFMPHLRKHALDDRYKPQSSSEDEVILSHRRDSTDLDSQKASTSSLGSVSEDEVDSDKPFYYKFIPPPYIKHKVEKEDSKSEDSPKSVGADESDHQNDSVGNAKPKPKSVRRRPSSSSLGYASGGSANNPLKPSPGHESVGSFDRPLKPPPGQETVGSFGRPLKLPPGRKKFSTTENDGLERTSSITPKKETGKGLRIWHTDDDDVDRIDDEEKKLDGFLMHYSTKGSPYERSKGKPYLKQPLSWQTSDDPNEGTRLRSAKSELAFSPRGAAQQSQSGSPTGAPTRRHVRAVSGQAEMSRRHVHPNLPDCDDLASLIAALKGR